jgi:branched-chain amino acid transport system permease protein
MRNRSSIGYLIGIVAALLLPVVIQSEYDIHIFVMVWIFALLVIGFNFIFGYIGQLSLGHGAYFAIGAYASALATQKWGLSFWFGLPFAMIVAGIFGLVIGLIALRWRSHFFVIATICFNMIIYILILNWVSLTNGPVGIGGIPAPSLGGMVFDSKLHFYYLALIFVLAALWFTRKITASPIGRAFVAIRENEPLAESVGISAYRFATLAFVIGTAMAGVAGSLYAHYVTYVSPEVDEFSVMISILVMVVLGGKGTVLGPVIGALIFTFLPEYLRFAKGLRLPIFGFILILGIVFLPRGIVTLPKLISSRWGQKKRWTVASSQPRD